MIINQIMKIMKKFMFMAAALLAVTAFTASAAEDVFPAKMIEMAQNAKYPNIIEVTGRAQKEVVPNEIYVRIVIDETALKQKQSFEKMESDMIKKLKSLGIDTDKDLKIGNMSSAYKDYFLKKNSARTSATYELKVSGVQQLGRVYQALESLGISNMNIIKLSHSDIQQFQDEMRVEALKNAQQVAQTLAQAVGQKAGRAVEITDYNNEIYVPGPMGRNEMMLMAKAADSDAGSYDTELEFKNIKLNYSVQAKFALQ